MENPGDPGKHLHSSLSLGFLLAFTRDIQTWTALQIPELCNFNSSPPRTQDQIGREGGFK